MRCWVFDSSRMGPNITLSDSDRRVTMTAGQSCVLSRLTVQNKVYVEVTPDVQGRIGFVIDKGQDLSADYVLGEDADSWGILPDGTVRHNGADIWQIDLLQPVGRLRIAIDRSSGGVWFGVAGRDWDGSSSVDPATGTLPPVVMDNLLPEDDLKLATCGDPTNAMTVCWYFGEAPMADAVLSGFTAGLMRAARATAIHIQPATVRMGEETRVWITADLETGTGDGVATWRSISYVTDGPATMTNGLLTPTGQANVTVDAELATLTTQAVFSPLAPFVQVPVTAEWDAWRNGGNTIDGSGLRVDTGANAADRALTMSTDAVTSKTYVELRPSPGAEIGLLVDEGQELPQNDLSRMGLTDLGLSLESDGTVTHNNAVFATLPTWPDWPVIRMAISVGDLTSSIWIAYDNGDWIGGGDPGAGLTPTLTDVPFDTLDTIKLAAGKASGDGSVESVTLVATPPFVYENPPTFSEGLSSLRDSEQIELYYDGADWQRNVPGQIRCRAVLIDNSEVEITWFDDLQWSVTAGPATIDAHGMLIIASGWRGHCAGHAGAPERDAGPEREPASQC